MTAQIKKSDETLYENPLYLNISHFAQIFFIFLNRETKIIKVRFFICFTLDFTLFLV